MGIRSTNGVTDHLKALARKGYIEKTGHALACCWRAVYRGDPTPKGEALAIDAARFALFLQRVLARRERAWFQSVLRARTDDGERMAVKTRRANRAMRIVIHYAMRSAQ